MKKLTALIFAVIMIMGMAACGNSSSGQSASGQPSSSAPANRLEEIKARGYIEVATEPYFSPYEFIDSSKSGDEQYVGMDIEIAKYIADKLGVELRLVPLEFSAVLASITEGKYDLAISALAYMPSRAENMNMSKGYYFSSEEQGYGILVREEDKDKYPDAASLKDAVVVMQSGSIQELFATGQIPEYKEFKRVSATTDGYLMVSEGKADACACAIANGQLYADANPGVAIATGFKFVEDETTQGTRVGIPLGEEELTAFVNEVIDELLAAGKTDEWYDQYAEYAKKLGIE